MRNEEFDYDEAGNRTRWSRDGDAMVLMGYSYDSFGRLDTARDSLDHCDIDYTYDDDGRRTRSYNWCENDGEPEDLYRYTAEGRMVQHRKTHDAVGGRRSERRVYWYDALGRRILLYSPDSTYTAPLPDNGLWRFYYSGNELVARSKSDVQYPDYELLNPYTQGTWFTPGLGPNEILAAWHKTVDPTYTHQFHMRDHRSSVVEVRNENNQYLSGASYTSYGLVTTGDPPQEAGFAGGLAAGDLVQFHNRYYDPLTGQFMTEDPIGFAGGENLYAYAANNPVTYTDPFGLCPQCAVAGAGVGTMILPGAGTVVGGVIGLTVGIAAAVISRDLAIPRLADKTYRRRDINYHHVATDKHKTYWTPIFQPIFERAGMKLSDPANIVPVANHQGRHPDAYHRAVLAALLGATRGKEGQEYKEALVKTLNVLAIQCATPGTPLNKLITK